MNKKIINGALFGLLVVAAPACSFVSCKDYNDDFASVRKEIAADKADLLKVKEDLNGQINSLKEDLGKAQKKAGELEAKLADYAKKGDLDPYAKKSDLEPYAKKEDLGVYAKKDELGAYAKKTDLDPYAKKTDLEAYAKKSDVEQLRTQIANIANFETRIHTLETAKGELETLINGKVDKAAYDAKIAEIAGKIDAAQGKVTTLETTLGTKISNLVTANELLSGRVNTQKGVLDRFEELLRGVEKKNFLSDAQIQALNTITTLNTTVGDHTTKITNLQTDLDQAKTALATVQTELANRHTKAEVEALINEKVSPLQQSIDEIDEALGVLENNLLTSLVLIPESYYAGVEAIESNQFDYNAWMVNKVENGVVTYTTAPKKGATPTTTSRYAEAVYLLNPSGALLDTKPENFTYLAYDRVVRGGNSEAQVTVKKATVAEGKLTVVLDIAGQTKDPNPDEMITVASLQYKAPTEDNNKPRIISSDFAAIYTNEYSDLQIFDVEKNAAASTSLNVSTVWDVNNEGGSKDIAAAIQTRGEQADGTLAAMDKNAAEKVSRLTKSGFHYEYHLVKTDANDKSYEAFELDQKTGVIKAKYDANKPFVHVGKTATVRVTLVRGTEVAALGFFKVHISQKDKVVKEFTNTNEKKFTCSDQEVAADKFEAEVTQVAEVLKAQASLEAKDWEFVKPNGELTQFYFESEVAKTVAPEKKLGKVTLSADGKKLVWEGITKKQVANLKPGASVATYVKVQKKSDTKVKFFVKLTYNPASEQAAPVAEFVGARISNDWFLNNIRTNEKELRMHFNIDPTNAKFNRSDKFMYSINESYKSGTVKINALAGYSPAVLASVQSGWRFVTPKEPVVTGNDGKQYTLTVSQNGLDLLANSVVIAKITDDKAGTIELLNNPTTQVLLNNAGHKQLKALETLTARVAYVSTVCAGGNVKTLETKGENEFDVKFLRPLDLNFDGAVEFTDANVGTTTKTLDFTDIVKFTDWRDRNAAQVLANDGVTLEALYGVTTIYVANEAEWTTNLNGDNIATTKLVENYGDRGLHMAGGTALVLPPAALVPGFTAYDVNHLPSFTYTTQQKSFKDYQVRVPVKVGYSWGTFNDHITVTIKGTLNNDTNNTRRK